MRKTARQALILANSHWEATNWCIGFVVSVLGVECIDGRRLQPVAFSWAPIALTAVADRSAYATPCKGVFLRLLRNGTLPRMVLSLIRLLHNLVQWLFGRTKRGVCGSGHYLLV